MYACNVKNKSIYFNNLNVKNRARTKNTKLFVEYMKNFINSLFRFIFMIRKSYKNVLFCFGGTFCTRYRGKHDWRKISHTVSKVKIMMIV